MSAEEVAAFYNGLQEQDVEQRSSSRILYLRSFNNWIKSMLIQDAMAELSNKRSDYPCVLDLCCGKGGDMLKWQKAEVDEIIFADVAEKSISQCRMRYIEGRRKREERKYNNPGRSKANQHIPFGASFITIDATSETLSEKLPRKLTFDAVSCQFALHYAFRSENHLRKMLYNVSGNLKTGGIFIGTMTDGEKIVRFLRKTNNGIYKNNVVTVEYLDKSITNWSELVPPLFGAKILFNLDTQVNCPEYLAYFPLLVEIAKEFKLELISAKSFPDAIEYYSKPDSRSLMGRMKALEEYPVDEERLQAAKENLAGKDNFKEEYAHAESKRHEMSKTDKRNTVMGTMSKSEWEAINMYTTFMFRKTDK